MLTPIIQSLSAGFRLSDLLFTDEMARTRKLLLRLSNNSNSPIYLRKATGGRLEVARKTAKMQPCGWWYAP